MKEFIVKTKMSEVKFNFPTNLKELSEDYLTKVTSNVTVAPNYSLIGLVYHERIANLILMSKTKKKTASIGVIPIFIKTTNGDNSIANIAKVGQKILVSNSQLELAYRCSTPNKLTIDYFANVIAASTDTDLYQKALLDKDQSEVFFVEFKIVPNCDIIALYDDAVKIENPYIEINNVNKE